MCATSVLRFNEDETALGLYKKLCRTFLFMFVLNFGIKYCDGSLVLFATLRPRLTVLSFQTDGADCVMAKTKIYISLALTNTGSSTVSGPTDFEFWDFFSGWIKSTGFNRKVFRINRI